MNEGKFQNREGVVERKSRTRVYDNGRRRSREVERGVDKVRFVRFAGGRYVREKEYSFEFVESVSELRFEFQSTLMLLKKTKEEYLRMEKMLSEMEQDNRKLRLKLKESNDVLKSIRDGELSDVKKQCESFATRKFDGIARGAEARRNIERNESGDDEMETGGGDTDERGRDIEVEYIR